LELHDVLAGLALLLGLVGIVTVILPGLALQVAAVAIWAFVESTFIGWMILALVIGVGVAAVVLKYLYPGRQLREAGIPGWLLLAAVMVAIVGLFAVPVVGAPVGFVLTIYIFERARLGKAVAWPSTKVALRAVFTSIGIELAGGFLIAVVFFVGAILA
jgi:hypothetical protein